VENSVSNVFIYWPDGATNDIDPEAEFEALFALDSSSDCKEYLLTLDSSLDTADTLGPALLYTTDGY